MNTSLHHDEGAHAQGARPLIQTRAVTKDYPGVRALDGVDFELRPGEVHVLFGENGAGKSTLISILAGANQPSSGTILVRGEETHLGSVHEARELGISAVFQEFSLIPQMTVAENLFLGAEHARYGFLDKKRLRREAETILDELGFHIAPDQTVDHLTGRAPVAPAAPRFRADLRHDGVVGTPKKIGFLSFGHWMDHPDSAVRSASDALLQSVELAEAAEELGADGAYFRVHHFARQLGTPAPLLAAVGARTRRIEIGTGVIDMR